MNAAAHSLALALLQVEPSPMRASAMKAFIITAIAMAFMITAMVFMFRYFRNLRNGSETAKLRENFDKSKEVLLAAAMAKKQASAESAGGERELSADEQEREALKESVEADRVVGQTCPICGFELAEDEELIIDPYTGAAYHLSDFLNDWPLGDNGQPRERPKFVYRYPQGTMVRSADLIRGF
jgi:hypothetical protein